MPRKKSNRTLTTGYRPINLPANKLINVFHGTGLTDRVTIFYKILFNNYKRYAGIQFDYTQYIPIHSDHLKWIFGEKKAHDAIERMVINGMIEVTNYYFDENDSSNNYPRSFRVPMELLDLDLFEAAKLYKIVKIKCKKTFNAEQIYCREKSREIISRIQCDTLHRLANAMDYVTLDLTSQTARQLIISHNFTKIKSNYSYYRFLVGVKKREIEWYKRDKFGRIHFAYVSLNKKCRSLVKFHKYQTSQNGEYDITNSQAFFSSIINQHVLQRMLPAALPLVEGIDFNTDCWTEYRNLCINGLFYEEWMQALKDYFGIDWQAKLAAEQKQKQKEKFKNYEEKLQRWILKQSKKKKPKKPQKPLDFETSTPRDIAKSLFYGVLFGTQSDKDEVVKCFEKRFKDVSEGFKTIKSRYSNSNPSKKNKKGKGMYTNLSWIMQKLESLTMIDTCVKNLLDNTIIEFIPRHDSILFPMPLSNIIKNEIEASFKHYQLPIPKIKLTSV